MNVDEHMAEYLRTQAEIDKGFIPRLHHYADRDRACVAAVPVLITEIERLRKENAALRRGNEWLAAESLPLGKPECAMEHFGFTDGDGGDD